MPMPPSAPPQQLTPNAEEHGVRLDKFLLKHYSGVPRSHIYQLLRQKKIRLNEHQPVRPDHRLQEGDTIHLLVPLTNPTVVPKPPLRSRLPKPLPITTIYEDEHIIAINKPANIAVHGGSGSSHGIIETMRIDHANPSLELVHRLDKGTSGVLLIAKKAAALRQVQAQWRDQKVKKQYTALVVGQWDNSITQIKEPLKIVQGQDGTRRGIIAPDGKPSLTRVKLVQQYTHVAMLSASLLTGRMHQLRVHLASINAPIVGDDRYGNFSQNRRYKQHGFGRLFLHAEKLHLKHPVTEQALVLSVPLPAIFIAAATSPLELNRQTFPEE